jgi:hypothetical protein
MKVGDLVRRKSNGEICIIIQLWSENGLYDYVTVITSKNEEIILHHLSFTKI